MYTKMQCKTMTRRLASKERGKLLYIRSDSLKDCGVHHFPKSHSVKELNTEKKNLKVTKKSKFLEISDL